MSGALSVASIGRVEVTDHQLSARQIEVLSHVALGLTDKEIGQALGCAEQTIKNHMVAIMLKLGARNRTHAVVIYLQNEGILPIPIPFPRP
jgi:two-component system NarL family response regulator